MDKNSQKTPLTKRRSTTFLKELKPTPQTPSIYSQKTFSPEYSKPMSFQTARGCLLEKLRSRNTKPDAIPLLEASAMTKQYIVRMLRKNSTQLIPSHVDNSSKLSCSLKQQILKLKKENEVLKKTIKKTKEEKIDGISQINDMKYDIIQARNMLKLMLLDRDEQVLHAKNKKTGLEGLTEEGKEMHIQVLNTDDLDSLDKEKISIQFGLQKELAKGRAYESSKVVDSHSKHLLVMQNAIMGECLRNLLVTSSALRIQDLADLYSRIKLSFHSEEETLDFAINTMKNSDLLIRRISDKIDNYKIVYHVIYKLVPHLDELITKYYNSIQENKLETKNISDQHGNLLKSFDIIYNMYNKSSCTLNQYKGANQNDEQICTKCFQPFTEVNNMNWSCSSHAATWSGSIYWCCGQTNKNAPGCLRSKHTVSEYAIKIAENNRCHFCNETHEAHMCPKDPNVRTGQFKGELARVRTLKNRKKTKTLRFNLPDN